MRIVTNIDPQTYERIKALVAEGHYTSVEQFLRAAADNQLAIETEDNTRVYEQSQTDTSTPAKPQAPKESPHPDTASQGSMFQWGYELPQEIPVRDPFESDRSETLLFSQYYRFLPLKFALLELSRESAKQGGPIELDEFRNHMKEAVIPLRNSLEEWEEANSIKKQHRFSTGFPKSDSSNPERSMTRYLNHYIGHYRSEVEEPSGFGHDLEFVSIQPEDDGLATIALSPAGERFLQLKNKVLDSGPAEGSSRLTQEEQEFLVTQIRQTLSIEYEFMDFVYDVLEHHAETYSKMLDRFKGFLIQTKKFDDNASENLIRSHTAGTISRMVALGILQRGSRRGYYETVRPPESYKYPRHLGKTTEDSTTSTNRITEEKLK